MGAFEKSALQRSGCTEQERLKALRTPADIYIINRENIQWLVEESGFPFDFDMAVIDELIHSRTTNRSGLKRSCKSDRS